MRTSPGVDSSLGKVDRYELIEALDVFGGQPCFRALDTEAQIEVMISRLPALIQNDMAQMATIRDRFANISRLHHPYISAPLVLVPCESVWYPSDAARDQVGIEPGDTLYVASYSKGLALNRWLLQYDDQQVEPALALHMGRQLADALDYAHQQGIVHGGIHTGLVQVADDARSGDELTPTVKWLDFGFARQVNLAMSEVSRVSSAEGEQGSYLAPEQRAGEPVSPATDQYLLAMLMFRLIGGAKRFEDRFRHKTLTLASMNASPEEAQTLPALDKQANEALARGLSTDPARRFPDCASLIDAMTSQPEEKPRPDIVRKVLTYVVLAAFLAVAVQGARWWWTKHQVEKRKASAEAMQLEVGNFHDHPLINRLLQEAATAYNAGEKARMSGDWTEAQTYYDRTIALLAEAELLDQHVRQYIETSTSYRRALATESEENLVKYAAESWQKIRGFVGKAETAYADDPARAVSFLRAALDELNRTLKALTPVLSVKASVAGQDVAARVTDGRNDWVAPAAITMTRDAGYSLLISHPDIEAAWSSMRLSGRVEWRGNREISVDLPPIINHTLNNAAGLPFALIKGGRFLMGSDKGSLDERPVRRITIAQNFWMSRTEVTQEAYLRITGRNPSMHEGMLRPVEHVTWHDAVAFCSRLTQMETEAGRLPKGLVYRLPTEAEWEYAAKGGIVSQRHDFSGSDDLAEVGLFVGKSRGTQNVAQAKPNRIGLYDMSGNVWEWCLDGYVADYATNAEVDPVGPMNTSSKVVRGGGWASTRRDCRVTNRNSVGDMVSNDVTGFRIVLAKPVSTY